MNVSASEREIAKFYAVFSQQGKVSLPPKSGTESEWAFELPHWDIPFQHFN